MKKYLVVIGAVILAMALASPSMAQFKSWGHLEIQTIYEMKPDFNTGSAWANNATTGAADRDLKWRHIAERFRFYLQYGDPKTVRAVLGFEADSQDWGEAAGSGTVSGGRMGVYAADQVQLEVKHAFLEFVVPNTPLVVKAGIQDFWYGGRFIINNDSPGLKLTANFAPHTVEAFWARMSDGGTPQSRATYGVSDLYGLDYKLVQKDFNVNAYFMYLNDLFTGQQASVTDVVLGSTIPLVNKFNDQLWIIGAGAGFRPGNWDFWAQAAYTGGEREWKGPTANSQDYEAYVAEVSAKYRIGPGMFVGGEFFYASGNDADQNDINYWPVQRNSEARSIFGNDRTVFFWMNAAQMGYYHNRNIEFSGMWYGRANFEYSPTAWLRFNLNYLYIGDTSEGTPGTIIGPSGSPQTKIVNSARGARQDVDEDEVGQEINLITTVNIYQGFVYHIGIAYFFPGKMFDSPTQSADEAFAFNTKLIYAF